MGKYNLTALVALAFLSKAGYGMEAFLGTDDVAPLGIHDLLTFL